MDHVRKIILWRVEQRGLTLKALSREIGKNDAYLQQFIHRGVPAKLPEEVRHRIAERLGLTEEELGAPAATKPRPEGMIDEIDVRAGAGPGGIVAPDHDHNGDVIAPEAVRDTWRLPGRIMRETLRATPDEIKVFEVFGDSMEPRLHSGDRVFVNTRDIFPHPEGIFALFDGIGIVVKRLQLIPKTSPQRVKIFSVNAQYDAYERLMDEIQIIGRFAGRFTVM